MQCPNKHLEKTMEHSDIVLVMLGIDIFYE